jgi:hypothetical protein
VKWCGSGEVRGAEAKVKRRRCVEVEKWRGEEVERKDEEVRGER